MKEYQRRLTNYLRGIFGADSVKPEWDAAKHAEDRFTRDLYCPRIDIAIGPFNTTEDDRLAIENISQAYERARPFVDSLWTEDECGFQDSNYNENPRCLMAIEIEKSGTRKHMLGDIVNACSLGKLGIIVAWDRSTLNAFVRIKRYLDFIMTAKKTAYSPKNLVIVDKESLETLARNLGYERRMVARRTRRD